MLTLCIISASLSSFWTATHQPWAVVLPSHMNWIVRVKDSFPSRKVLRKLLRETYSSALAKWSNSFFFHARIQSTWHCSASQNYQTSKKKKNSRCIAGREVPIIRSPFPIRFWWVEPVSGQSSCLAMDLCPNLPAPKAEPNWRHSANPLVASPGPGAWLWADPHITRHTTHGAFWGEGRSQLGIIDHHSDLEIWMEIVQYSSLYSSLYSSFIHTYSYIFIHSLYRSKSPRSTRSDLRTSSATHQEQRLFGLVQLMVHLGRNFNDFQSATRRRDGLRRRIWKKKSEYD